jgi:hypothetical protein
MGTHAVRGLNLDEWWTIIRDLRTALAADPLPMETIRELLVSV